MTELETWAVGAVAAVMRLFDETRQVAEANGVWLDVEEFRDKVAVLVFSIIRGEWKPERERPS